MAKFDYVRGAKRVGGAGYGEYYEPAAGSRVVFHTEGVLRGKNGSDGNAYSLAEYVARENIAYHVIVDSKGRIAQTIPASKAARSLKAGSWSPNRRGRRVLQVCFAGIVDASEVAHWGPAFWQKAWPAIHAWAKANGVPDRVLVDFKQPSRGSALWLRSGYVGHCHAPFNDHTDGRGAPMKRLLEEKSQQQTRKVVCYSRRGRRVLVRRKPDGKYTLSRKGKGRATLTKAEAREAVKFAKRKGSGVRVCKKGSAAWRYPFLGLASGVAWPKDKRLLAKMNAAAKAAGVHVRIVSGYRTLAQQRHLYDLYRAGKGNLAAYPNPRAPHIRGVAADCGVIDKKGGYMSAFHHGRFKREAEKRDIRAWVPGEAWHLQRRDTY